MKEDLKDLVSSEAWEEITKVLEKRKAGLIRDILSQTDLNQITRSQAAIRELDYVVQLPHELINKEEQYA